MTPLHCVDCIYRDTPSARIDRLIPIGKQLSDGRLRTAASGEKEPPSHSRLSCGEFQQKLSGRWYDSGHVCIMQSRPPLTIVLGPSYLGSINKWAAGNTEAVLNISACIKLCFRVGYLM